MLTETEARELLQQAASTIDVRPGVPVVAPVRRSWLVPAIAAAAVLAAVTTGFLVVREHDGSTSPTRPVPTPVTPTPTSTDRIPSVFAYDSGHALRLLANLGLQVTAKEKDLGCGSTSGRALSTSPPVGSRFKPGDPVTLLYSGTGQALCPLNTAQDSLAWKVLDFANGRGQDPGFTSATQFWLNGVRADSTDAFAALSALTREGGTLDPHRDPVLTAGSSSELGQCRAEPPLPAALQSRTPYRFDIGFGGDLSVLVACPSGRVYLRPDGTIDAIAVDAAPQLLAAVDQPVDPDAAALAVRLLKFANTTTERFPGNQTVRFYDEGIFWNSLTAAQAEDRDSYSLCSGLDPAHCTPSYLDAMEVARGGYEVKPDLPSCFASNRIVGETRGGGTKTAYIVSPSTTACAAGWAIQLRYDSPDELVAVNVLSTRPDPERDLRDRAHAFIDFALGTKDVVSMGYSLRLYETETWVRTLSRNQAMNRASYQRCGSGRRCVIDAIQLIGAVGDEAAFRTDADVPACLESRPPVLTGQTTGGTTSVLIADIDHPCAWGVQLWFDNAGEIVAIDLRGHQTS